MAETIPDIINPASIKMESKKWGIVGGGIMGMTLAHRLSQQGHKATVFESAPELGGLVSSWKMPVGSGTDRNDVEWDNFIMLYFYQISVPAIF